MAIPTIDAVSSSQASNASSLTFSHTVSGTNRVLLVFPVAECNATPANLPVTGITYNGVALTKIRSDQVNSDGGEIDRTSVWYLIAPDTGAHNVVITYTGQVEGIIGGAISLNGAKQSAQPDSENGSTDVTDSATTATASLTTVAENVLIIDVIAGVLSGTALTVGAGQTQRFNVTNTGHLRAAASTRTKITPGSQAMSWTLASNESYAMSVVSIAGIAEVVSSVVAASSDDANQWGDNTNFSLVDTFPTIGNIGGITENLGLRFQSIYIPQGSTISTATITFTSASPKAGVKLKIYAQAADDPVTFANTAGSKVNDRTKSSASVSWTGNWPASGTITTVDISTVVQEIISRSGWVSGNSIVFIIVDDSNASSTYATMYSYDSSNPAQLDVTYAEGLTVTTTDPEEASNAAVAASANTRKEKRYLFLVETKSGEQKAMTENWDFDSITRGINGSSEIQLTTNATVDDFRDGSTDVPNSVIVRVSTDKTDATGLDYFSGFIAQRSLNISGSQERVNLRAFGHISRLYQALYRSGSTTTLDYTGAGASATTILKALIDAYRVLDSNAKVSYTSASVEESLTTVKDKFELVTFGEALERVANLAQTTGRIWFWRVLGDNLFTFKKASLGPDHSFIMGKDITEIRLDQDLVNAANEMFVYYDRSNTNAVRRYKSSSNITTYGYLSRVQRESNVPDTTTADAIGNALLQAYTPPVLKISVRVSDTYDGGIEFINPGDTCEILNIPTELSDLMTQNMLITKTIYTKDEVEIELSIKHPRLDAEVEKIRRDYEQSRAEGSPTTFTDV